MGSHFIQLKLGFNVVINWPADCRTRPKHVAKYNLTVITASCLHTCCVMTVRGIIIILLLLLTAIVLSPGGSGYFTCIQNTKLVSNKFKSGGLHEKHVVATWNVGNHLSICL